MNYQQSENKANLIADSLEQIAVVLDDQLGLAEEAKKLRQRAQQAREDRFLVLVVGEFSRGKSTLLNAMLGDDILPRRVTESTAVVTRILYDQISKVHITFDDGRPDEVISLADFRNRYELNLDDTDDRAVAMDRFSHVVDAVLHYPVELCRHRIELVDTPGLGAHKSRMQRTQKFLTQADAIVFVLYAPQFLKGDESHFLESILIPMGLKNVFFVINGWNLIDESVIRPEDADRERAELESHISRRLNPFCFSQGRDRSSDRIFRVNALGALKARMRKPPLAASLEESNIPAFEHSLEQFLVEDRGKARSDATLGALKSTTDEVNRYIAMQMVLAEKSIGEIEAEQQAIQPQLQRLRGIRREIVGFLQSQSALLQDRLAVSFQSHMKRIESDLPSEVSSFDLKPITDRWLVWAALTDWMKADEEKFGRQAERCLEPQVLRLMERRFGQWQGAVRDNEIPAVMIDVQKHLQEEAAAYQQVIREIEEKIGIHATPMQVKELVEKWLRTSTGTSVGRIELPESAVMSDFKWLIGSVIAEIVAEAILHITTGGITLIIMGVLWLFRFGWREATLRSQIQGKIIEGIGTALNNINFTQVTQIRASVRGGFEGLEAKITGNIDEEIAIIDASLQVILDRKKEKSFSCEKERETLESARRIIATTTDHLHSSLAVN